MLAVEHLLHLLNSCENPTAAAISRLDEVPDLVDGFGGALLVLADQAGEAHAGNVATAPPADDFTMLARTPLTGFR